MTGRGGTTTTPHSGAPPSRNEVVLWGRLAAPAVERTMPSGDVIVTLRLVIPRRGGPTRRRGATDEVRRATVDTIDVVCWTAVTRRAALRLDSGEAIEVEGALRRRFFGAASGRQSRYDVEATVVRRLSGRGRGAS